MNEQNQDLHFLESQGTASYPMSCPNCQAPYSVEASFVESATGPLKFDCPACSTRFGAELTSSSGGPDAFPALLSTFEIIEQQAPTFGQPERKAVIEAPLAQFRINDSAVDIAEPKTRECPRCHASNRIDWRECKACGILFDRFISGSDERFAQELELSGRRDLISQWETVVGEYTNQSRHEEFIKACLKSGRLPYAAQKYAAILEAAPNEEIALQMRKRVMALAGVKFDFRKEDLWKYLIPSRAWGFNGLLIFLGTIVTLVGMGLPNVPNLAGVGFAMIALAIGIRVYIRRPD